MPTEKQLNIILESEVEFNSPSTYLPMEQTNKLCKCGKVGEISCPNDERCGSIPTQLPKEVVEQISIQAEAFANKYLNGKVNTHEFGLLEEGYQAGANEYATKLHEARQLIEKMNERCKGLYHDELANEIKKFLYGE